MRKMTANDICEFCDGKLEQRVIQTRFHFKGHTIYVDGVPNAVSSISTRLSTSG